jgi:hypothetical protein
MRYSEVGSDLGLSHASRTASALAPIDHPAVATRPMSFGPVPRSNAVARAALSHVGAIRRPERLSDADDVDREIVEVAVLRVTATPSARHVAAIHRTCVDRSTSATPGCPMDGTEDSTWGRRERAREAAARVALEGDAGGCAATARRRITLVFVARITSARQTFAGGRCGRAQGEARRRRPHQYARSGVPSRARRSSGSPAAVGLPPSVWK